MALHIQEFVTNHSKKYVIDSIIQSFYIHPSCDHVPCQNLTKVLYTFWVNKSMFDKDILVHMDGDFARLWQELIGKWRCEGTGVPPFTLISPSPPPLQPTPLSSPPSSTTTTIPTNNHVLHDLALSDTSIWSNECWLTLHVSITFSSEFCKPYCCLGSVMTHICCPLLLLCAFDFPKDGSHNTPLDDQHIDTVTTFGLHDDLMFVSVKSDATDCDLYNHCLDSVTLCRHSIPVCGLIVNKSNTTLSENALFDTGANINITNDIHFLVNVHSNKPFHIDVAVEDTDCHDNIFDPKLASSRPFRLEGIHSMFTASMLSQLLIPSYPHSLYVRATMFLLLHGTYQKTYILLLENYVSHLIVTCIKLTSHSLAPVPIYIIVTLNVCGAVMSLLVKNFHAMFPIKFNHLASHAHILLHLPNNYVLDTPVIGGWIQSLHILMTSHQISVHIIFMPQEQGWCQHASSCLKSQLYLGCLIELVFWNRFWFYLLFNIQILASW